MDDFLADEKRVADIIKERRDNDTVHDLLGLFMAAEDPETGEMTDQQLGDEVLTMLSAGHDPHQCACLDPS